MNREELRRGIIESARALGIDPIDLATTISYETGGTFDPLQRGPTTQWGQHRGLIQFGEPQARKFGVDWNNPMGSQLGEDGAVVKYLQDAGVKPGMGLLDVYSAINAGGVGLYDRSDANNGGAPGTVRDKVEQQMGGHRRKAEELIGAMSNLSAGALDFARDNPQPGGFGAEVEGQSNPMFPPPPTGGSPFGGFGIPPSVAEYASAPEPPTMEERWKGFAQGMGAAFDDIKAPRPSQHPGGPSKEQANALASVMDKPRSAAEMFLKRRLAGYG